jgi:hypothetical protein
VDGFNTRTGPVTLSSADVTNALTPVQPNGTDNRFVGINVTGSSASATIAGLLTNVDQEQFHHQAVLQTGYNLDLLLGIIIIQVLADFFTFKKLPRWNRWVRQFSYIFKVRNRNEGLAATRVSYCICNRMLLLQMTQVYRCKNTSFS